MTPAQQLRGAEVDVVKSDKSPEALAGGNKLFDRALKFGGSGRKKVQKPKAAKAAKAPKKPEGGGKRQRGEGKQERAPKPEGARKRPGRAKAPKAAKVKAEKIEKPTKRAHKIDPAKGIPGGGAPEGMYVIPNKEGKTAHLKKTTPEE